MKAEALPWLLKESNPAVRKFTLTDVMGKPAEDKTGRTLVTTENLNDPSRWVALNCYGVLAKTGDLYTRG